MKNYEILQLICQKQEKDEMMKESMKTRMINEAKQLSRENGVHWTMNFVVLEYMQKHRVEDLPPSYTEVSSTEDLPPSYAEVSNLEDPPTYADSV